MYNERSDCLSSHTQRSNAARMRNMSRFNGGKLPGNQNTVSKSQKTKQLLVREAEKVPVCLPLTLLPRTLFCHSISSKAFLRTSLRKRFELIKIVKALTTGCDVGFLRLTT